jgi:hypothetical protein
LQARTLSRRCIGACACLSADGNSQK